MNPNQRQPNESFKAYRARLRAEHKAEKEKARGHLIWTSAVFVQLRPGDPNSPVVKRVVQGSYIRKKHGEIGHRLAA